MSDDNNWAFSMWVLIAFLLAGVLLATGCATLGKDECLHADWRSIGYEDGARGLPGSQIGKHRKACAKHGVRPNLDLYERGRREGLREYCIPRKGYYLGLRGNRYNGNCPRDLEGAFLNALEQGRYVYGLEMQLGNKEKALKKKYNQLDVVEQDLADMEAELIKDGTGSSRRRQLLGEIRLLEDEQKVLVGEVDAMEQELVGLRRNLSQVKEQSPYK